MANDYDLADILSEFARTMVSDFPIQGILDHLIDRIVDVLPITGAGVTLISPDTAPRYIAASSHAALRFEKLQTELGEGPCLAAYASGEAVIVADLAEETRFPLFTPRALEAGLAAVFTFPLRHRGRQLGALDLYRDSPGGLTAHDMTSAQTLADVAAAYLLNAQARADLTDSSDRAHQDAMHDRLTGLANRALLLERLDHAFRRGRRSDETPAVLFADLDGFKAVNDTYGHRAGDDLLMAVGARLTSELREGDTLSRLSGDEFVMICENVVDAAGAELIAERVRAAIGLPFPLSVGDVNITVSIGVALASREGVPAEEILHDADVAMYRAKASVRRRRHLSDQPHLPPPDDHGGLEGDLSGALNRGEFHLEYQPIVDTDTGRINSVEALLRWDHPTRGDVSPTVLIPLAEHAGLMTQLGGWILEQAWTDRWSWNTQGADEGLGISVNVSASQLMSPGFVDAVRNVVDTQRAAPHLLTLEVTENIFIRDSECAVVVLHGLEDLGVLISLDDFGTGFSSLSYLRQFPVDTVKIDQSFVNELGHDPTSLAIVTAVIQLAHDLGMTAIAEGVETADQHHLLNRLGCDSCQGYYFARPMPASSLRTLIDIRIRSTRLPVPV
jgi:diguanylate cyclase (GGDEF)-like protein